MLFIRFIYLKQLFFGYTYLSLSASAATEKAFNCLIIRLAYDTYNDTKTLSYNYLRIREKKLYIRKLKKNSLKNHTQNSHIKCIFMVVSFSRPEYLHTSTYFYNIQQLPAYPLYCQSTSKSHLYTTVNLGGVS